MFALFMTQVGGPGPVLGQGGPTQNPTQPGLGPGWARVELGSAEV